MLKLLFVGDIVGRPGRDIVALQVPKLRIEREIDFVIANAENSAAGAGITGSIAKSILGCGVDAITLGDHVWDQRGWENEIGEIERVCRPANLPAACPGWDHLIIEARGFRLAVFTVLGRSYMNMMQPHYFARGVRLRFSWGHGAECGTFRANERARRKGGGRWVGCGLREHAKLASSASTRNDRNCGGPTSSGVRPRINLE